MLDRDGNQSADVPAVLLLDLLESHSVSVRGERIVKFQRFSTELGDFTEKAAHTLPKIQIIIAVVEGWLGQSDREVDIFPLERGSHIVGFIAHLGSKLPDLEGYFIADALLAIQRTVNRGCADPQGVGNIL